MRKNIFALVFSLLAGVHFLYADEANDCERDGTSLLSFNVPMENGVSIGALLDSLAGQECFSVVVRDRAAKDKLSQSIASVKVNQLPLEKVFDLLLTENELNYEFDGNVLKVSYLITETFHISYIGTSRIGASNTDVILSQNANTSDNSTNNTTTTTTTGSGLTSAQANSDIQSDVHYSLTSNGLQGGTVDSISGTKILSLDQFDFWGRLEREIFEIAFRPGDTYQPKRVFSNQQQEGQGKSGGDTTQDGIGDGQSIIINKMAGLVTVTATVKQLDRVRKYIKNLENQIQNQVVIDVNILTVTHSNSNTVGVDWDQFWNFGNLIVPAYTQSSEDNSRISLGGGGTSINIFSSGVQLTRVIEFLNAYGKVRSVSNPKILTLNNQPALISVGSILRYQQSSVYQNSTSGGTTQNESTSFPSVFAGVLLDVTPSISGDYIMLKINPSVTATKDSNTENEATALTEPPNLSSNQLSSLVRAKDGDRVILGGLISKSVSNTTSRVPILGYIPLLKYLFSYDGTSEQTTEMVIIITPHIVKGSEDNPSLQDLGYTETVGNIVETNDASFGLEDTEEDE